MADFAWAVNELKAGRAVKRRGLLGGEMGARKPIYTVFMSTGAVWSQAFGEEKWPWVVTPSEITAENWQPAEFPRGR